jgi:hypothetical protein
MYPNHPVFGKIDTYSTVEKSNKKFGPFLSFSKKTCPKVNHHQMGENSRHRVTVQLSVAHSTNPIPSKKANFGHSSAAAAHSAKEQCARACARRRRSKLVRAQVFGPPHVFFFVFFFQNKFFGGDNKN